jgi:predicted DNA-binding antitoxin AbrB/MazE fold protein
VYEKGLLRPLEPLELAEQQRVSLTVTYLPLDPANAWIQGSNLSRPWKTRGTR